MLQHVSKNDDVEFGILVERVQGAKLHPQPMFPAFVEIARVEIQTQYVAAMVLEFEQVAAGSGAYFKDTIGGANGAVKKFKYISIERNFKKR